jgi:hypothetical protein
MSEQLSTPNSPNRPAGVGSSDSDRRPDPQGHSGQPPTTPRDRGGAEDAGRTSGGGNSGHKPDEDVNAAAPIRNNPR